jgi:hypothetical protein
MTKILAVLVLRLLTLAYGVALPASHPEVARVETAAGDLARAMELEGVDGDVRLGKSALVMSWYESALYADPKGDNDHGRACGVGQVHVADAPKGLLDPAWTCEALRADRVTGYRAELRVIVRLRALCGGDLFAGWHAYATGSCPAKGEKTISLVLKRMKEAGVSP